MVWFYIIVMTTSSDLSQEIIAIDVLTVLKSSLEHRAKHILRSCYDHIDQAIGTSSGTSLRS